ncbi:hypothetical protein GCK72_008636 [Caenorhabditis remanei]|uniref:Uncharacterized protein n=2 Tax=Caenorhabditis remanei TaxID=31234 RepID=E3NCV0_CAERE|nr:hypothetical protein GCK72_008636 [Caenorhabditis remanei]EFO93346.1 hypothetical protein CRE_24792 [Caenorhabditis remanei]KAF1760387.1 hypothetical protein GCK72_008636 [Caenorhabditis remanei]
MQSFSSVCLLALLAVSASATTNFDFSGLMKCQSRGIWCFTVRGLEIDTFSDDIIAEYTKCSSAPTSLEHPVEYAMTGVQEGDGILDSTFEVAIQVTHNCTANEQTITTDYIEVPIKEMAFSLGKNFDLNANAVMP